MPDQTSEQPSDCLFCGIVAGDLPSNQVAATDDAIAIEDINPVAPVHLLVIPRRHVASLHDLGAQDAQELAGLVALAQQVAQDAGIADGYRVATNIGTRGGQVVFHLHLHVVGGRQLGRIDSMIGSDPG